MRTLYFRPVVSSSFFLAYSQPSQMGCLPYFHSGPSANLECMSRMCCTRLVGNTRCKKSPKIVIWAPSHKFVQLYIFATKTCINNRKKLVKHQYLLHMSSQYGELRPTNGWDLLASLGHPSKFQPVSPIDCVTAPMSLNGGEQNFAGCLAVSYGRTLYEYSVRAGKIPNGICFKIYFASKSYVLLYWQRYCTALKQRPSAKLCGMVQGMELGNFRRVRHLHSAGRPSRWASAHILVDLVTHQTLSVI